MTGRVGRVLVRNIQCKHFVDQGWLAQKVSQVLEFKQVRAFDVSVLLCGDRTSRRYNRKFRGVHAPTDVISIPFQTVQQGAAPRPFRGPPHPPLSTSSPPFWPPCDVTHPLHA